MSDTGDQTEAELEKTRQVVAASMAEQIAVNDAAAATEDTDEVDDELEALRAEAEAAGITVDRRWGVARLESELADAEKKSAKSKKEA